MRWIACLSLLLVAGCGGSPDGDASVDVGNLDAIATAGPTVAEVLARGDDRVPAQATPAGFDQAGDWAATPASCRTARWRFAASGVTTGDGTRCTTRTVRTVSATSQRLELACTSDGIATIESWALNLHADGGMTVSRSEGGNGMPRSTMLRRCG